MDHLRPRTSPFVPDFVSPNPEPALNWLDVGPVSAGCLNFQVNALLTQFDLVVLFPPSENQSRLGVFDFDPVI